MAFIDLTAKAYKPAGGFYTSEVQAPTQSWDRPLPVRTFLPHGYEPRYPYPLLVFFHGQGGNEEQILRLAPRLSRRNFICIGLRGPVNVGPSRDGALGYSWGGESNTTLLEDYLVRAVQQTRANYHVHSERVYLAGFAEGATVAYRLGLSMPEKLGGVISLNGAMPRHGRPLFRLPTIRSLRVFIGHGLANAVVPLTLAKEDYRLLYTAGAHSSLNVYPVNHRIHPDMLRDINRWIIARCNED